MNADADIHVWLETIAKAQTSIIIPHVQSNVDQQLQYEITTLQKSRSGRSSIGQSGYVYLKHNVATPLSRLTIRRSLGDSCQIELFLHENSKDKQKKHYIFPCPDPAEGQ